MLVLKSAVSIFFQFLSLPAGIENKIISEKIEKYKLQLENKVLAKAGKLEKSGWKEYLSQ